MIYRLPKVNIGPMQLTNAVMGDALEAVDDWIQSRKNKFVCFCEANLLSNVYRFPELKQILDRADAVFPDGVALMKLAELKGIELPERIPGPTFILKACEYGISRGWKHFFLGGAPGVPEALAQNLKAKYPGLQVAGMYSPPFRQLTASEELDIKTRIEASGADLLWVALGSPKQEMWVADHVGKIDVPVMLPVGAAFDFHTRTRPWAPSFIRQIGMEWLFRTFTGGRQTFIRNVRCVSVVALLLASAYTRRKFKASRS